MRRRVDPWTLLLLTPVLWGATFPATKLALEDLPPFAFMAWSRTLGFLAILAAVPLLRRTRRPENGRSGWSVVGAGCVLGGCVFVAYVLQTEGIARTSATNAGFITGLYVVFTPILVSLFLRRRVPRAVWLAVLLSVVGLALLSVRELEDVRLHLGDALVLAGAVAWAAQVTAVDHFSPHYPAWLLSLSQMGATAAFQLVAVVPVGLRPATAASLDVWPLLLVTGVLGSGLAYTLQIIGQQSLNATRAVVVLASEAIFAAIFAAIWIGERLKPHQWLGAVVVLVAIVWSEMAARRPAPAPTPAAAPVDVG